MLEHIYICRHGFRANWIDPSIKTGPTGMNRDPPLAAYGTEQADQLATFLTNAEALAPYPIPERVFSSPFYRCIQTAVPTYQALNSASGSSSSAGNGVMLEHGVQEWYSNVNPDTGLHPRPSSPAHLAPLFPPNTVDIEYISTYFPSRRGENMKQLQDRADLFVEAWIGRVEEMGLRSVVVFAHAASVIALGRALTGDKSLEVVAGCASTSLYKRKSPSSNSSGSWSVAGVLETVANSLSTTTTTIESNGHSDVPCGVGQWDAVYTGRADYLTNGLERDWSFRDAVIVDGEVIPDNGDRIPHPPEDQIPDGLVLGMERYLRRGKPPPNTWIKEIEAQQTAKGEGPKM